MKDHQYVELYTTSYSRDEAEWFLETWKRMIEKHEQLHGVVVLWYECSTVETFEREWHLSGSVRDGSTLSSNVPRCGEQELGVRSGIRITLGCMRAPNAFRHDDVLVAFTCATSISTVHVCF